MSVSNSNGERVQSAMTMMIMKMVTEMITQLRFPRDDTNSNGGCLAHSRYRVVHPCLNLKH